MARSAVFALLAILAVIFVSASAAITKAELEQWMIGFGEGLEDEQDAGTYLEQGYLGIEKGIKDRSVSEIRQGFQALGLGFQDVSATLKDCNFTEIATDIEKIAREFQKGAGGIIEIVIKELVGIFIKRTEVTNDFKVAISAWKSGDYQKSGYATGNLVGILIEDGKKR